jgi:hypothetical protein
MSTKNIYGTWRSGEMWDYGDSSAVTVTKKRNRCHSGCSLKSIKKIRELAPAPHNGGYRKSFFHDDGPRHSFMTESAKIVAMERKRTGLVGSETQLGRLSGQNIGAYSQARTIESMQSIE